LPLTAILSKFLTIDVISLTAVPSVLHAVAPRRAVCEFPESVLKKKKKEKGGMSISVFGPTPRQQRVNPG
jgi:hypothetical protein